MSRNHMSRNYKPHLKTGSPTSIIQTAKQTRGKPHTYDTSTYKKPIISSNSEELSNQNRNQRETWRRHDDELVGFRDRSIVNLHGDATACSRYPTLSVEVTAELSHQRARLLHLFSLQIRLRETDRRRCGRRHWLSEYSKRKRETERLEGQVLLIWRPFYLGCFSQNMIPFLIFSFIKKDPKFAFLSTSFFLWRKRAQHFSCGFEKFANPNLRQVCNMTIVC